jgi:hypothetical protein
MFIKFSILLLLIFISLSCNQASEKSDNFNKIDTGKTSNTTSTFSSKQNDSSIIYNQLKEKVTDTIFKLPEVKERAKYIEQKTKGKRHLMIWIADTPNLPVRKYYWVKVGEDNGMSLVTHFNFFVYFDSMRIMYLDVIHGTEINLDAWRRNRNKF